MKGYEDTVPGSANRIIPMAEKRLDNKMQISNDEMKLDDFAVREQFKQSGRGQYFAITVVGMFLGTSLFAAFNGFETLSLVLAGATAITGIVNAFLKIKDKNKQEK